MRFFYGARTRADLFYLDGSAALAAQLPDFNFIPALSHAAADDELGRRDGLRPRGRRAPFARREADRRDRRLCLRAAADDRCVLPVLQMNGVEPEQIYFDKFTPAVR